MKTRGSNSRAVQRYPPRAPTSPSSSVMWVIRASSPASCPAASSPDVPRRRDYAALLSRGASGGCPALFLAPMEGLGDRRLRRALALSTGGFDEACREFTRVPGVLSQGAKPERLLRGVALNGYDARELMGNGRVGGGGDANGERRLDGEPGGGGCGLLAAQLMGSNAELLERCARFLAEEGGAPRVDLNCGCPANVVTGKGAGSSLLRDPNDVEACIAAVKRGVAGTGAAVSLKLRSGYDDRGLLRENLLAAQAGGAEFVTLHPRTRAQGYSGRAQWADIALAVDVLDIPVVGNGDVTSPRRAAELLNETGCAGLMIGRGAVQDPLVFRRIAAALGGAEPGSGERYRRSVAARTSRGAAAEDDADAEWWGMSREEEAKEVVLFLRAFAAEVFAAEDEPLTARKKRRQRPEDMENFKLGKLKQICKYLFASNQNLAEHITRVLGTKLVDATPQALLDDIEELVMREWGVPEDVLVDAFSMRTRYADGVDENEKQGRLSSAGVGKDIVRM